MRLVPTSFLAAAMGLGWVLLAPADEMRTLDSSRWALPSPLDFQVEDLCNGTATYIDVELYRGTLGVSEDFVKKQEPFTAQLQWVDDLPSRYNGPSDSPGSPLLNGRRWCSATLIAPDLVLTAGHCVSPDPRDWQTPRRGGNREPAATLATLMVANFNYQVDGTDPAGTRVRNAVVYRVAELVEYGFDLTRPLDYAVLRLAKGSDNTNAGDKFSIATIDPGGRTTANTPRVAVIQHPDGEPKKIEAGEVTFISRASIQYRDLDTLGGSSGAGVISEDRKLIGVHLAGGCASNAAANEAVTLAEIARVSSTVRGLLR